MLCRKDMEWFSKELEKNHNNKKKWFNIIELYKNKKKEVIKEC